MNSLVIQWVISISINTKGGDKDQKKFPHGSNHGGKGVIIMQVIYTSYGCKVGHNPTEYATDEEALEALEIEQDSDPPDD